MATTLADYIRANGLKSSRTAFSRSNHKPARTTNVGTTERLFSLLSGGVLAAYGLSRRNTSGLLLAGVGAALVYRGASGHCDVYQALRLSSADSTDQGTVPARHAIHVEECITILRPPKNYSLSGGGSKTCLGSCRM